MALNDQTELINQFHNPYFYAMIIVLNKMEHGESIPYYDFINRIKQILKLDSEHTQAVIAEYVDIACKNGILAVEDKTVRKLLHNSIIPPMSMPEQIYLKNILKTAYASLFLDEEDIQYMLEMFSDVPDVDFSEIIDFKGIDKELEANREYIKDFRLVEKAILEKNMIQLTNFAHNGQIYRDIALPMGIEFSMNERYFWLWLWNTPKQQLFKTDMGRITNIRLMHPRKKAVHKAVTRIKGMQKNHRLIMAVQDKDHAIEKINRLFSTYPKEIKRINEGIIWLAVEYPRFDEKNIIDSLMSFGTAVQVISPASAVNMIKERLQNQLNLTAS